MSSVSAKFEPTFDKVVTMFQKVLVYIVQSVRNLQRVEFQLFEVCSDMSMFVAVTHAEVYMYVFMDFVEVIILHYGNVSVSCVYHSSMWITSISKF